MCLKVLSTGQFVGSSNSHRYHWILKILISTEQSEVWEKKYERLFYYFNFERNNYVLKSKSPFISLNKNIYFNKNEKESKMENPTHRFRETNLESQIKSKSVMSWSSRRKKEGIFCNICFARRIVFKHLCYI